MTCKICEGPLEPWLSMPIDAKKNEATPFKEVHRCQSCGTGMLFPRPAADDVPAFYKLDNYYTQGASHIAEVPPTLLDRLLVKVAWWLDRAKPFTPSAVVRPGMSVLDLGCGDGVLLAEFQALGCDVLGVDPDPLARDRAAKSGIKVLPGTGENTPAELEGRTFDLVVMTHSLEHCIEPQRAIQNAYALTKSGGSLYIEVPNCECVHFQEVNICSENFDSPRHLAFFTTEGLKQIVSRAGFAPGAWHYSGFTRHHGASWRAWELTIADRVSKADPQRRPPRHNFTKSLSILARTAFAPFAKKYDAIGLLSVRT
jgi:SAM-dependent methyltransferase